MDEKELINKNVIANQKLMDNIEILKYQETNVIQRKSNQDRIRKILSNLKCNRYNFLDIGCGDGNLLKIAKEDFKNIYGLDVSIGVLKKMKKMDGKLINASGYDLPIKNNSFDVIGMYATLHHLALYQKALVEVHRVLRKGGCLYVDHDTNQSFLGFQIKDLIRVPKENNKKTEYEMAEYHHNNDKEGFNTDKLKKELLMMGFSKVIIQHYIILETPPNMKTIEKIALSLFRLINKIINSKYFSTHFLIIAYK